METNDKAVVIMSQVTGNEHYIGQIFWFMYKIHHPNYNYLINQFALNSAVRDLDLDNLL
jgi:hypothetical protein